MKRCQHCLRRARSFRGEWLCWEHMAQAVHEDRAADLADERRVELRLMPRPLAYCRPDNDNDGESS